MSLLKVIGNDELGTTGAIGSPGQKFCTYSWQGTDQAVDGISVYCKQTSGAASFEVAIYRVTGPTSFALVEGSLGSIAAPVSEGWVDFIFDNPIMLSSTESYGLALNNPTAFAQNYSEGTDYSLRYTHATSAMDTNWSSISNVPGYALAIVAGVIEEPGGGDNNAIFFSNNF